jgi:hypothetical protein
MGERLEGSHGTVDGFFDVLVDIVTAPITLPVKAAGQVATAAVQTAANAAGINVKINPIEIPIVSDVSNIIASAAAQPFKLADAIASGERLDRALIDNFKRDLKIIKDVAPYVQTVVSFVPGIGTGVAAAIAAGTALAEGKSIDEVAKAALRGAVPGGPAGAAAFDVAMGVVGGKSVDKAVIEAARAQLPEGAKQAFDIGVAIATGENLQNSIAQGLSDLAPAQLKSIIDTGAQAVAKIAPLATAIKGIAAGEPQEGFKLAAGLLSQKGISEKAVSAVRGKLTPAKLSGFDAALKVQAPKIGWLDNVVKAPPVIFIAPMAPRPPTPEDMDKKMLAALMVLGANPADKAARQQLVGTSWQWAAAWQGRMKPADTTLANALGAWAKAPDDKAVYAALIDAAQKWGVTKGIPVPKKAPPVLKAPTPAPAVKKPPILKAAPAPVKKTPAGAQIVASTAPGKPAPVVPPATAIAAGRYAPYPKEMTALSGPPHGGYGGHGHGGHGHRHGGGGARTFARGGSRQIWAAPWWGEPYNPEVVTRTETCRTWGDPISPLLPAMDKAARMALGMSSGKPTMVRGPDNVLYLFAFENGVMTARACAAVAVA